MRLLLNLWLIVALLLVLLACTIGVAHAQAGSNQFSTWSTERVNGRAVTTFEPRGGSTGSPMRHVVPSAIGGGVTRTATADAVKFGKSLGIPYTSGTTGVTQTLAVTASRVATKQAIVKAVARTAIGANPLGMTIMIGMAATEIFKWEDGQLKTKLVEEISEDAETYPATQVCKFRTSATGNDHDSVGAAIANAGWGSRATGRLCSNTFSSVVPPSPCSEFTLTCQASVGTFGNIELFENGQYKTIGFVSRQQALGCPNGGTLQGNQCVKPAFSGCPDGYQVVPELTGDYRCAPVVPASKPDYPATEEIVKDTINDLSGSDPAKIEDMANWWSNQSDSTAEPMELGNVEPSGASQLQPSTSTTPTQNNGTKETTVQPNVTYNTNNSTVTITENVTHIYRNENGEEVGRETEENPQEDVPAVTDKDMPTVPDFYTQKYENGMGGVWNEKKAQFQSSPFTGLITALGGNFSDGGQCPQWTLPSPLLGLNFNGQVQVPCWIWDALGVIFVVTSLFMARRIIFGG